MSFELVQVGSKVYTLLRKFKTFSDTIRIVVRDLLRQALWLNGVCRLQRDRPLDCVLEFTDVARPDVALQQTHGILAY